MPRGQRIDFDLSRTRIQRGWSQETLADLAKVNVRTIRRAEAGRPIAPISLAAIRQALFPTPAGLELAPRIVIAQTGSGRAPVRSIEVRRVPGTTPSDGKSGGASPGWIVALVYQGGTWCLCPDGFLRRYDHEKTTKTTIHRFNYPRQADAILAAVAHMERHRRAAAVNLRMTGTRRRMVDGAMRNCAILSSDHHGNLWTAEV